MTSSQNQNLKKKLNLQTWFIFNQYVTNTTVENEFKSSTKFSAWFMFVF